MRRIIPLSLLAACLLAGGAAEVRAAGASQVKQNFQPLKKPGEKVALADGSYFTYSLDKTPKLGTLIMRIEIFGRDGKRDTGFRIAGDADMPSMRGAHSEGDKPFVLSSKGVYLMPVRLVMPGDWEVSFTIVKGEKVIYRGAYLFDI